VVEPLLPSEAEKPKGGRPRASDRAALRGIESRRHLGRHRWIVERTLAWLASAD
jgi:transposase